MVDYTYVDNAILDCIDKGIDTKKGIINKIDYLANRVDYRGIARFEDGRQIERVFKDRMEALSDAGIVSYMKRRWIKHCLPDGDMPINNISDDISRVLSRIPDDDLYSYGNVKSFRDSNSAALIGTTIKEKRISMGMSISELSNRTGIHFSSVRHIETAKHKPFVKNLSLIMRELQIDPKALLTKEQKEKIEEDKQNEKILRDPSVDSMINAIYHVIKTGDGKYGQIYDRHGVNIYHLLKTEKRFDSVPDFIFFSLDSLSGDGKIEYSKERGKWVAKI
jgi:transcriptional regulator with XRE-family HTH domain